MHCSNSRTAMVLGALLISLALASCGQGTPGAGATTTVTTSPASPAATATVTATATATPTASETGPKSAGWSRYTTTNREFTFDYPSAWTIKDPAGELAEGRGVFVEVKDHTGKTMATLRSNMATGSTCTEKYHYAILDTQPLPALAQGGTAPRFVFESRNNPNAQDPANTSTFAYGITSGPEPTGDTACPIFQFFTWPPNAAMFSGVYDPFAPAATPNPGVDTPEAYMETEEYHNIKKMITSLKPAS